MDRPEEIEGVGEPRRSAPLEEEKKRGSAFKVLAWVVLGLILWQIAHQGDVYLDRNKPDVKCGVWVCW